MERMDLVRLVDQVDLELTDLKSTMSSQPERSSTMCGRVGFGSRGEGRGRRFGFRGLYRGDQHEI